MDDVPEASKHDRMVRMVELYRSQVEKLNKKLEGTTQLVLIEGVSLKLCHPQLVQPFLLIRFEGIHHEKI